MPTNGQVKLRLKYQYSPSGEGYVDVPQGTEYDTTDVVSLQMINPAGDPEDSDEAADGVNEFTFEADDPYCYIRCQAQVSDQDLEDDITWSISSGIDGSTMTWGDYSGEIWTPGDNKGAEVWIRFENLPSDNGEFGLKTVSVSLLTIEKENDIEIFFDKDATNHPSTMTSGDWVSQSGTNDWPNWLYYWCQTVSPLEGVSDPLYLGYNGSQGTRTALGSETLLMGDNAATFGDKPYAQHNTLKGIDLFAWAITHECQHNVDNCEFWDNNLYFYDEFHKGQGTIETADDKDKDLLPNNYEETAFGTESDGIYDWEQKNTEREGRHGDIVDDEEDYNCLKHTEVEGDHEQDWANPGMQHDQNDEYDN
jgi:hypothetical protein